MPLLSDLRNSSGLYLYDLLTAPGVVSAAGAGATGTATASDATVYTGTAGNASGAGLEAVATPAEGHGYNRVTITEIGDFPGSIFYGWDQPWGSWTGDAPQIGDVVRYPTLNGFTIESNGEVSALDYGVYTCFYDDGTGEVEFVVTLDDSAQVFAQGATAAAQPAESEDLYGGVNVSGAGQTVTATPAQGGASAGNIATGAGATVTATAAGADGSGGAEASGDGVTATAEAAEAVGEQVSEAEGAGVTAQATAAEAEATGDVEAVGAGVTVQASAAVAIAQGSLTLGQIPYKIMTRIPPRQRLRKVA